MKHDVAFLHTAGEHVASFDALMAEVAPNLAIRHDVDKSLLADARVAGDIGVELASRIEQAMLNAASSGARVVVCTCSTIGGVAERAGQGPSLITQRIDRAMADAAARLGPRILIVASLRSTVEPTRQLIAGSASRMGRPVSFREMVVADAWQYFERSMPEAYIDRITNAVKASFDESDVIVLAQASMAGAVERCRDLKTPVLASPRLGVAAAIEAFERSR